MTTKLGLFTYKGQVSVSLYHFWYKSSKFPILLEEYIKFAFF